MLPEQRTLPHSAESERAVLGALLLEPQQLEAVSRRLAPEDFYLERHVDLFRAMLDLRERGEGVDLRTLQAHLEALDLFERVGGIAYLSALDLDLPDLGRIDSYVEIVKARSTARSLLLQANRMTRDILDGEPLRDLIEQQAVVLEMARRSLGGSGVGGYRPFREAVLTTLDVLEPGQAPLEQRARGVVSTGISRLDARFAMETGTVIFLGGRPGQGKTVLLWQIAEHNALAGRGVGIQQLEMSGQAQALRALCHHSQIAKTDLSNAAVGRGDLQPAQWSRAVSAARQLSDLPVWVDTTRQLTGPDIGARLRKLKDEHPEIVLVELDYINLVSLDCLPGVDPRAPKHEKAGALVRYLRNLAGDIEVVMLVGAQLTRDNEKENRRPKPVDLRDAGEQDADAIVFIHRDPKEDDPADLQARGDLILAKAREGKPGSVPVLFDGSGQRFSEPTSAEIEEERALARAKRKPRNYERED